MKFNVLFLFTSIFLLSCGGNQIIENSQDTNATFRIINGTEHGAEELPQFVKVLAQDAEGSVNGCTGTIIAPKVVVTATHCIIDKLSVIVQTSDDLENGPLFEPEQIIYESSYGVLTEDGRLVNDLALIFLKKSPSLPPLPLLASAQPSVGDYLMVVGFGVEKGENGSFGVRRSGTMRVNEVDQFHIISTFDAKMSNVCFGDSGGPIIMLLKDENGNAIASALAGITSWGTSQNCKAGETVYFTNIYHFISGILELVPNASIA